MKKNTKIAVLVLAVLVIAAVAASVLLKQQTTKGAKTIKVEVQMLDGTVKKHTFHTDAEYLYDAVKEILSGSMEEYGFWITGVDGVEADDSKQQWWSVEDGKGEMLMTGVSETPIQDGDLFRFVLVEGYDW